MKGQQNQYEIQLILPNPKKDDIDQEIALLKLQGVPNPSRSIVSKRLANDDRAYLVDDFTNLPSVLPLFGSDNFTGERMEAITNLLEWAAKQADYIETAIHDFLEDPSEASLRIIMGILEDAQLLMISAFDKHKKPKKLTLTELIRRSLRSGSCSIEQLYILGRENSPQSKRPEAAVRQALRRMERLGEVNQNKWGEYFITQEKE